MNNLYRPHDGRMIAGVCAALGRRFGISVGMIRILAVLSCLLPGPQFIAYIILWIMIPSEKKYAATHY
ncbi:MAG TPA: PspC domain-containing protein [Streptosporangiaceae bacterium]|jgi:phage shock protein PspC (stress-responsive transcriptional regulator)|nr:PspC domain-containing protein [Streptosporangiaceae bacterium]